ncbi:MAG TPA: PEGA domain-containing protein [Vicinamibacterales bacterium]|nr:PEGA domain-containing protein [Vicinamibacterales bacterium]
MHTDAAGAASPDAFGPFRVLHQIGAGTLGPVFRAYDSTRERLVAVKLFKLDLPPERAHHLAAEFEQLIAAGIEHPAVVAPLATGISGVSAFLAQDYVAADSLDLAVREYGPAPAGSALRVAAQLAGALDAAAAAQIAHGALHPRDVLLSSDDTRLTGLGVTRALEKAGVIAPVRRPYSAPERIAGGDWDRRADVFSLAALMHELMWGRRVSGLGAKAAGSLTAIAGSDLAALQGVFARALAENRDDRFESALEFAEALRAACPGVAVAPEPAVVHKRRAVREEAPRLPLGEVVEEAVPEIEYQAAPEMSHEPLPFEPPALMPAGLVTGHDPDAMSAIDRTRSAVWPLVLALVVGIAIGFAGGFFAGSREQPSTVAAAAPTVVAPEGQNSELRTQNSELRTRNSEPKKQESAISNLQSAASEGRLRVRSRPVGAHVVVDGKDYGVTPAVVPDLARGAHRVTITRDGFATLERRFVISSARPAQSMTVTLLRAGAATPARSVAADAPAASRFTGALAVDSRPAGARVFVDNKVVGTTPMALPAVSAGSHVIRLEHDGYLRWSSSVRVIASEQNRVTASLER